jgi:hypothetical protein
MGLRDSLWAFVVAILSVFVILFWMERQGPEKQSDWKATVYGVPIIYQIVIPQQLDSPLWAAEALREINKMCHVYVDARVLSHGMDYFAAILAHETGHCIEQGGEGIRERWYSTIGGGASKAGCRFGKYYCDPAEGFAETWGRLYLQRCGFNLATFGWPDTKDTRCRYTPSPGAATPKLAAQLPVNWWETAKKP